MPQTLEISRRARRPHDPLCGGSALLFLTTPVLADHGDAVPVSKSGLPSNCEADG
jgi:hypothetical protein